MDEQSNHDTVGHSSRRHGGHHGGLLSLLGVIFLHEMRHQMNHRRRAAHGRRRHQVPWNWHTTFPEYPSYYKRHG